MEQNDDDSDDALDHNVPGPTTTTTEGSLGSLGILVPQTPPPGPYTRPPCLPTPPGHDRASWAELNDKVEAIVYRDGKSWYCWFVTVGHTSNTVSFSIAVVNDSVTLPLAVPGGGGPGGLSVDRYKGDGGGKQPAIRWDKPISVIWLNFAAKTFRILQDGSEMTCRAVECKPNDAIRFLFDNHFWQEAIREWINKSLSVHKAVDGWSGLEAYGKRMKWPVKQVFSTPQKDGTTGRGTTFGTTF
jgi:hypothetical protein